MSDLLINLLLLFVVFGGLILVSPKLGFPEFVRILLALIFVILVVLLFARGPFLAL